MNRAGAYFAQGDKQHALDDYNDAIKLAPRNASLYYNRGVFYAAQSDDEAAFGSSTPIDLDFQAGARGAAAGENLRDST